MSKKVTITTIANEVGMSIAAVSRAFDKNSKLKPEKRKLILETSERLGYTPNRMAARLSLNPIKIGIVIYGNILPYYSEYIRGIQYAHSQLVDYKVEMELVVVKKGEQPICCAYDAIDKLITEGCDGVVLGGFDEESDLTHINSLAAHNIPFILLDTDIKGCRRSGVSMKNSLVAGQMAAQLLGICMAQDKNAAVICHKLSNISQKELVESFLSSTKKYGYNVSEVIETDNELQAAYEYTGRLLSGGNIGGIYVSSAISSPVCRCISERGLSKSVGLVVSDLYPEITPYISDGTIFATIVQNPFLQARQAFEALFYHITEKAKIDEFMCVEPIAVFESNLKLYTD